jgi:thioredoxin reductase (NADPH)
VSDAVERELDALVVGGGIAGLTAARLLAQQGYTVIVADEMCAGGRLLNLGTVLDYPGLDGTVSGPELAARCTESALDTGVEMVPTRVIRLDQSGGWIAQTSETTLQARAVVLATGRGPDHTALPRAADFAGRGVSHCASCDGPLFAGKSVAVAGSGRWLATEVQQLASLAESVTAVLPGEHPAGPRPPWERTADLANVHVVTHARVAGLEPDQQGLLDTVVVEREGGAAMRLSARALFLCDDEVPSVPEGLPGDVLEPSGAIRTHDGVSTELRGMFAAGDVRAGSVRYAVAAAADGIRAALAAGAFISGHPREAPPRTAEFCGSGLTELTGGSSSGGRGAH